MPGATLPEAKLHLRVDHGAEDAIVQTYLDAARDYLESLGIDFAAAPVPKPVVVCQLLIVVHLYENRGDGLLRTPDDTWMRLIAPYLEHAV